MSRYDAICARWAEDLQALYAEQAPRFRGEEMLQTIDVTDEVVNLADTHYGEHKLAGGTTIVLAQAPTVDVVEFPDNAFPFLYIEHPGFRRTCRRPSRGPSRQVGFIEPELGTGVATDSILYRGILNNSVLPELSPFNPGTLSLLFLETGYKGALSSSLPHDRRLARSSRVVELGDTAGVLRSVWSPRARTRARTGV